MAIDTKVQETLKLNQSIKNMRRGGSPEPSCQLPTAPAHSPSCNIRVKHAHWWIQSAKRNNHIQIPNKCEVCCSVGQVVAHHPDYDKPFYVVWLCYKCHGKLHLGKFMVHQMIIDCVPEMFEDNTEKLNAIENAWEESIHVIDNEYYIKGTLQTAII